MRLQDKVIIVTGSTTGIGEAIARRCVAEGARVLVHGRNQERGQQVVADMGRAAALHIDDLADPLAPQRLVKAALDAFDHLDGIVNNAAYIVRSDLDTTSVELFDRVMAINVRAPLLLIQAGVAHLKQTQGAIVNIGSVNAYTGEPRQLAYSMSKAALMTMSRNLANVLAYDHVRVTHFNVGWVITPNEYKLKMSEGLPEGWSDHPELEHVPTGKMTRPEEIAAHAVFWLSDESRPISGSVIDLEQHPVIGRIPLKEGEVDDSA
jgi:NAD(P)-dependent dehydrogenase (short-subunit alcohol dehydrogenase family)